jgi:hypothetical protein
MFQCNKTSRNWIPRCSTGSYGTYSDHTSIRGRIPLQPLKRRAPFLLPGSLKSHKTSQHNNAVLNLCSPWTMIFFWWFWRNALRFITSSKENRRHAEQGRTFRIPFPAAEYTACSERQWDCKRMAKREHWMTVRKNEKDEILWHVKC